MRISAPSNSVEALSQKLEHLERANKQVDESAISRVASQISELDEAMEVRENENAALDGRVEKLELRDASMADRVASLQLRVDDVSDQCKMLNNATLNLDEFVNKNAVTKDELVFMQSKLDKTATKSDISQVTQKVAELEDRHNTEMSQIRGAGDGGSVTARSLHSERDGSFSEFHDELAIASEGSARIRALAARVRGVTQQGPPPSPFSVASQLLRRVYAPYKPPR